MPKPLLQPDTLHTLLNLWLTDEYIIHQHTIGQIELAMIDAETGVRYNPIIVPHDLVYQLFTILARNPNA